MDSAPLVLAIALSGVTELRGVYRERFYTGACDREGVAGWQDRPAGGKRLFVGVAGDAPAPALAQTVTAQDGTFAMSFRPPVAGQYCVAHQGKERLVCLTSFGASTLEGAVSTSVVIGPVNPRPACVSQRRKESGQTPEPPPTRARATGRAVALDGTLHVRGQIVHQTTYWGGAYRREPPPVVTAGNTLRIRRGDRNGPQAPVAEVVTDEQGFDVALPPGVWCFETAYHDDWFKQWARPSNGEFDRACLKRKYETCDFVARLGAADIEGVRISTTQWHPPSFPCRARPYMGSSPP